MIKTISCFLLYIIFISSSVASGKGGINQKIDDQLKRAHAGDLNLGVYIENLDTGKTKFALHSNRFFIPASVTKIFTSYTVLKYLGADYKIPTNFIANKAKIKNHRLDSNLYIKFHGDASFTYVQLVHSLKALGINSIHGNVVIDGSFLDDYHTSPGGFTWDDKPFYYAAPKSAIIIDKNTSEAWMKPADRSGEKAQLRIDRPYVLDIVNNVDTVKPRKYDCPYKSRYVSNNTYEVYGCMFDDIQKDIRLNFALQDNKLMAYKYIQQALRDTNIRLYGKIEFGSTKNGDIIYQNFSPSLSESLDEILSDSCNLTSVSVFKHMAALKSGRPGSDEDGEALMKQLLERNGISSKGFYLRDGSGESRYNLITPKTAVRLLKLAYKDQKIRKPFIEALPQYGREGTVKYRNVNGGYGKFIYAKTGTFKGVSALAGYYLPPKGPQYVFAIMSNNSRLSWSEIKGLEDKILHIVLNGK